MNIYFDTEFTGLHKDTTLISIGMVADNGKAFYAEFTDYDASQVNNWITDNVISKLKFNNSDNFVRRIGNVIEVKGDKEQIREELIEWLASFDERVQFVSDVCHYDFVLLIDLIAGHALKLPDFISPTCHDINQDIAIFYNISELEAFDKNRENIVNEYFLACSDDEKHNALADARVIRHIVEIMSNN